MTYEPHELRWMLTGESWPTEAASCAMTGEPVSGLETVFTLDLEQGQSSNVVTPRAPG
jgi:hypothetical protein